MDAEVAGGRIAKSLKSLCGGIVAEVRNCIL
jgi:hypothetical protein